jgi:hypothetical protein
VGGLKVICELNDAERTLAVVNILKVSAGDVS